MANPTIKSEQIIASGGLFLAKDTKRFLFLLRTQGRTAGTWGLVGGRKEPSDATAFEALRREVEEEIPKQTSSKQNTKKRRTEDNSDGEEDYAPKKEPPKKDNMKASQTRQYQPPPPEKPVQKKEEPKLKLWLKKILKIL